MINRKRIEVEAQKLLTRFGAGIIPVPVEDIVKQLGIRLSFAPSEDYSGILIKKEGATLMAINNNEPDTRRRFTIAHELGHFLFSKEPISVDYRNTSYIEKPPEEKCADLFAANLLMPRKQLILDFERFSSSTFSQTNLINLAEKYQVSQDAMKYRLANLNLIELT